MLRDFPGRWLVSNKSAERQLFHVNKKGRPVSQCQHCRGLRKSRATHIKCVCAEPSIYKESGGDMIIGNRSEAASTLQSYDAKKCVEERKCRCGNGLPCTCALKREHIGTEDLQKSAALNLARTHRRAHSYGKPVISKQRSDTIVPQRNPHGPRPPLHRLNNSAHESNYPYAIKHFTSSARDFDEIQAAAGPYLKPPHRSASLHRSHQSTSNLPELLGTFPGTGSAPEQRVPSTQGQPRYGPYDQLQPVPHTPSRSAVASPSGPSEQDFQTAYDPGFMNNALSPGNPSRYSLNDFSDMSWPAFSDQSQFYNQPSYSASASQLGAAGQLYNQAAFAASTGQLQPDLASWNGNLSSYAYDDSSAQTPQRNSLVSLDHPELTYSPSNTISDVDSAVYHSDTLSNSNLRPSANAKTVWSAEDIVDPQRIERSPSSFSQTAYPLAYRPRLSSEITDDRFGSEASSSQQAIKASSPFDMVESSTLQYPPSNFAMDGFEDGTGLSGFNAGLQMDAGMQMDRGLWNAYSQDGNIESPGYGSPYTTDGNPWRQ